MGGAPFNVAWHLRGFGLSPLFISRVGQDEAGQKVLSKMREWNLDTAGVQTDRARPTGTVRVTLEGGQPRYHILPDQAYDFIDADEALAAVKGRPFSLLHHGTLAMRSPTSRAAAQRLEEKLRLDVFLDPNMRSPWWQMTLVKEALRKARWAKLSDEELAMVSGTRPARGKGFVPLASRLRAEFGLEMLVVTLGAYGAFAVTESEVVEHGPVEIDQAIDPVGAGDAFDAVIIMGLVHGWALPVMLGRAVEFAAAVCRIRGATVMDHGLYSGHLERWRVKNEGI